MLRLALLIAGCQSVYQPLNVTDDSGTHFNTSATTGIGGVSNPDLAVTPDGSVPLEPTGSILIHSGPPSVTSASFAASSCTVSTVSTCMFFDCSASDMATATQSENVGTIQVATSLANVTLTPLSDGSYPSQTSTGLLWPAAGGSITVTGSGGDFASFTTMLAGPSSVSIVNPLTSAGLSLSRAADFNFSWTGGTTGTVTVDLAVANQKLECSYSLAGGVGTIPSLALSKLSAGTGTIDIVVADNITVDGAIAVRAEVPARDSGGAAFSASVTVK